MYAVLASDAAAALRIIDQASDAGADMQELLRSIVAEERNLLVAQLDPQLLARDLSPEDERVVRDAAAAAPRRVAGRRPTHAERSARRGALQPNPRLDVETVVMRLVLSASASRQTGRGQTRRGPAQRCPGPRTGTGFAGHSASRENQTGGSLSGGGIAYARSPSPGQTPTIQRVRALWQNNSHPCGGRTDAAQSAIVARYRRLG